MPLSDRIIDEYEKRVGGTTLSRFCRETKDSKASEDVMFHRELQERLKELNFTMLDNENNNFWINNCQIVHLPSTHAAWYRRQVLNLTKELNKLKKEGCHPHATVRQLIAERDGLANQLKASKSALESMTCKYFEAANANNQMRKETAKHVATIGNLQERLKSSDAAANRRLQRELGEAKAECESATLELARMKKKYSKLKKSSAASAPSAASASSIAPIVDIAVLGGHILKKVLGS